MIISLAILIKCIIIKKKYSNRYVDTSLLSAQYLHWRDNQSNQSINGLYFSRKEADVAEKRRRKRAEQNESRQS